MMLSKKIEARIMGLSMILAISLRRKNYLMKIHSVLKLNGKDSSLSTSHRRKINPQKQRKDYHKPNNSTRAWKKCI